MCIAVLEVLLFCQQLRAGVLVYVFRARAAGLHKGSNWEPLWDGLWHDVSLTHAGWPQKFGNEISVLFQIFHTRFKDFPGLKSASLGLS